MGKYIVIKTIYFLLNKLKSPLKNAYRVNSVQKDVLVPLDWMENITPEKWLLNGEEKYFNCYEKTGNKSF